jgi:hypothetical protein
MIINLLSSPRNVSTALMYSFAQRPDMKVVDEPFYGYYLSTTEVEHPGKDEIISHMPVNFDIIFGQIQELQLAYDHVFLKNMAHHLIGLSPEFMSGFANVFLIRHPKLLITSFAKVMPQPTMRDIGVKQQWELYTALNETSHIRPVIIDSGELLKNPSKILTRLCQEIGLKFYPEMLAWKKGGIPEDGIWANYWYENVHNSTGFDKPSNKQVVLPANCQELFMDALPYYHKLAERAITI